MGGEDSHREGRMTCPLCGVRPCRLSGRSDRCVIYKVGTKKPRVRRRASTGYERGVELRRVLRRDA